MPGPQLTHSSDVASYLSHRNVVGDHGSFNVNASGAENTNSMNRSNKTTVPKPSGPIIAGNCVSCMGMVRISHSMSVNATVRCPHCQESFVLRELLDQSLPPLEVVVNEQASDEAEHPEDSPYIDTLHLKREEQAARPEKPRVKFEIPKALRDGAKKKRRRRRSRSSSSSSSGGEKSSSRSERSSRPERSSNFVIPSTSATHKTTSETETTLGEAVERRRSSSSGSSRSSSSRNGSSSRGNSEHRGKVRTHTDRLKEAKPQFDVVAALKVFFGCMFAFSLAYLMLIWVFKTDPLGVAPSISKSAPFVIPSSMQNAAEPEVEVKEEVKRELPSYLSDDEDVKPFEPQAFPDDVDRIAVPDIDPDEVFGQEFGL